MARKAKLRTHREHFRTVLRGGRKSCSNCKRKLPPGQYIYAWGEYVRATWRTVQDFCRECWPEIKARLQEHRGECGCTFELVGYHQGLPSWLKLDECPLPEVVTVPAPVIEELPLFREAE